MAHSAYPDSPLGPDAYHEYESLLNQDYEELVKKRETDHVSGNSGPNENTASEDEGWSELTSIDDDISRFDGISSPKPSREDYFSGYSEDIGHKLAVSVHHFPLILCPFSPRVFVLPSEGCVAEASLSAEHENSISSGLPPLSTGKLADAEDVSPGASLTAQFLYHLALKVIKLVLSGFFFCETHFLKNNLDSSDLCGYIQQYNIMFLDCERGFLWLKPYFLLQKKTSTINIKLGIHTGLWSNNI